MEVKRFPIYKYDYIFNKFNSKLVNNVKLCYESIEINYPCRLDAMAINPSAVCYNDSMVFTPGEVVISAEKFINVKVKVMDADKKLEIGENTITITVTPTDEENEVHKRAYCRGNRLR